MKCEDKQLISIIHQISSAFFVLRTCFYSGVGLPHFVVVTRRMHKNRTQNSPCNDSIGKSRMLCNCFLQNNRTEKKFSLTLSGKCFNISDEKTFSLYYPTELNNTFWLAKSQSIWRQNYCIKKSKYGKKKCSIGYNNKLLRNCLVVPFVKKWSDSLFEFPIS